MTSGGKPAEHPQPKQHLVFGQPLQAGNQKYVLIHHAYERDSFVIFDGDIPELLAFCLSHSSSGQQDAGRQSPLCDRCTSGEQEPFCTGCYYLKPHNQQVAQREREKAEKSVAAILEGAPNDLRMNGWAVAIHNDYRQNGEQHTFWLLTNADGTYLKGEGTSDAEALNQIREALRQQQGGAGDEQR